VGKQMALKSEPIEVQHSVNHLACDDVTSVDWQLKLFKKREQFVLNDLAGRMFVARQEGKSVFETWMLNESDNVQALATAYGENLALEQFNLAIQTAHPSLVANLKHMFTLYALDRVVTDGVFYLQNGIVNAKQMGEMQTEIQRLCALLGKEAVELTGGFGIPDHMHHAPIANDWVEYNRNENDGELKDQSYRHPQPQQKQKTKL